MNSLNKIITASVIIIPLIITVYSAFSAAIAYIAIIAIIGIYAEYLSISKFIESDKHGYKFLTKINKWINKNRFLPKFEPSTKTNEWTWLVFSIAFPIYFIIVLYFGGFFLIITLPQPSLNGQFINFGGGASINTSFAGCGNGVLEANYISSSETIVDGNAIGGNLTLISVGHNVTVCNISGFPINLNIGIYPDFKQLNLTFSPFTDVRINATPASLENSMNDYIPLKGGNGSHLPIIITIPNSTGYLYSGEYTLNLDIEAIAGNATFYPDTFYHLFTVNGILGTSRNFLTNFNIYLKVYPNESSLCSAQPSFC